MLVAALWASTLALSACGDDSPADASSQGEAETCGQLFCEEGSEGEEAAGTEADESESESQGESGAESGGGACTEDEDCGGTEICNTAVNTCVPDCGKAQVVLTPPPPPVMLVLDKSGSMVANSWDHDENAATPDETRWDTLVGVTQFILGNFEQSILFGMQLFPSVQACPGGNLDCYNDGACVVGSSPEVGIAETNASAILAALPPIGSGDEVIRGGTPAADGVRNAITVLQAQTLPDGVDPAIILVTDGAANCGQGLVCEGLSNCPLLEQYDAALPTVVGDALNDEGIATYVVGIDIIDAQLGSINGDGTPDANPFVRLNEVAVAGGRENTGATKFYNATNEAELMGALNDIAEELVTCEVDLSKPPNEVVPAAQIPFVEFIIEDMLAPKLDISEAECLAGAQDGWIWLEPGVRALFCGSFCDSLKTSGEVDGIYNCPLPG